MKTLFAILLCFILIYPGKAQTLFIWPVKQMPAYSEIPNFYSTNNFMDLNPATGLTDWACGGRTYEGHNGTDIDLWPFTWSMMDNNYVAAVAAAAGRVVTVVQNMGNENNCGAPGENLTPNYIGIRHADGSTSFYVHIRTNSAQVAVGQDVIAGQIIAFVGSSGGSSNPHMHFEVNSTAGNTLPAAAGIFDPYFGTCNFVASRWAAQKPYREPAVVRVMTHSTTPSLIGFSNSTGFCKAAEVKNAKAAFVPNDSIYFGVAMRDYLQNQSYTISVFDPNGTLWTTSTNTNTGGSDLTKKYYLFGTKLASNATAGTWQVKVSFNGTNSYHFFSVNCPASQTVSGAIAGVKGYKASGTLTSTASAASGNRLFLQAGSKITLSPGFAARNGSTLKARIKDCNYSE